MSGDDYDFREFIQPVEAAVGFDTVFDQRQITVQTYSTNLPFEHARLKNALEAAWMGPTTPLGVVQVLSSPADKDVRVVVGLQGESKVRTFEYETHRAHWWSWRATIRETVAIRYSADPGGMLRFTTLGGGARIREKTIKEFHSLALNVAPDNTHALSLNPYLIGQVCFENRFLHRLYSLKARLENAERYGSIEHAEFASSKYLDPDCDVIYELRNMPMLPVDAFESVVSVKSKDLGELDVRFTIRASSGALRLNLPKLEPGQEYSDDTAVTRAFYDFIEAVAAEIVKPEMYVEEATDPALLDPREVLFPERIPTSPYREFLRTHAERERWLWALDVFAPPTHWVPHLHALDELLAGEEIAGQFRDLVNRFVGDAPRHAVGSLAVCCAYGWTRLGSLLRDYIIARLDRFPVALIPRAEDAIFDYGFQHDRTGWDVNPVEAMLSVHDLRFPLDELRPGTAGYALLVVARCLHHRLLEGGPASDLLARSSWCLNEVRRRCADKDLGEGIINVVAAGTIPHQPEEYRALRPGAPVVTSSHDLDERLLHVDRLPLWPSLVGESSASGWRLRNDGHGTAYDLVVEGLPTSETRSHLEPGGFIEGAWIGEKRPVRLSASFQRYGKSLSVDVPLRPSVNAGPLFEGGDTCPRVPEGPRRLERRDIARRLSKVQGSGRPVGASRSIFRIYEQFVMANIPIRGKLPPVLLLGETGVGKTRFFEMLHALSDRGAKEPMHANGGEAADGGDPNLYRGQWIGYGPGHALNNIDKKGEPGRIELAQGSTFFIDDCELMGQQAQGDLLALLDGRPVQGVGRKRLTAEVRFVFATNKDPDQLVRDGVLRGDLLARIPEANRIVIPPLRERPIDVLAMAHAFATGAGATLSCKAWLTLFGLPWKDNARQLRLVVEAAARNAHLRGTKTIDIEDIDLPLDGVAHLMKMDEATCRRELWITADRMARIEWGIDGRGTQTVVADVLDLSESEVSKTYGELGIGV